MPSARLEMHPPLWSFVVLLDVIRQKCEFKGMALPVLADLQPYKADLEGGWSAMLSHQLPAVPPFETFLGELPAFFDWLSGGAAPVIPAAYVRAAGKEVIRERTLRLLVSRWVQFYLEIIRFAASNRLCVDLLYQGSTRRIEPYSLRRTKDGNIILHAHNITKVEHHSYRVDRIQGAQVTNQTFVPRFEIELTPRGPIAIAPTTTRVSSRSSRGIGVSARSRPRRVRPPRNSLGGASVGLTYVYECAYCSKRFKRKKQTISFNPHKDRSGYPCAGRYAQWVDTQY